jgi:hypothetical protein
VTELLKSGLVEANPVVAGIVVVTLVGAVVGYLAWRMLH